jgi:hypothetical protein
MRASAGAKYVEYLALTFATQTPVLLLDHFRQYATVAVNVNGKDAWSQGFQFGTSGFVQNGIRFTWGVGYPVKEGDEVSARIEWQQPIEPLERTVEIDASLSIVCNTELVN